MLNGANAFGKPDLEALAGAKGKEIRDVCLDEPHWHALFFVIGGAVLLAIGLTVRFTTGLSAADDRVFAVEALASGLVVDFMFRKLLHKRLTLIAAWPTRFIYVWPLLCLFVFIVRPFE